MIHEENGKIIVDELRPMSEAPRDGTRFLAKHVLESYLEETYFDDGLFETLEYTQLHENQFTGWLPMPIYRQKVK